jgi:hypothetical protein
MYQSGYFRSAVPVNRWMEAAGSWVNLMRGLRVLRR